MRGWDSPRNARRVFTESLQSLPVAALANQVDGVVQARELRANSVGVCYGGSVEWKAQPKPRRRTEARSGSAKPRLPKSQAVAMAGKLHIRLRV